MTYGELERLFNETERARGRWAREARVFRNILERECVDETEVLRNMREGHVRALRGRRAAERKVVELECDNATLSAQLTKVEQLAARRADCAWQRIEGTFTACGTCIRCLTDSIQQRHADRESTGHAKTEEGE